MRRASEYVPAALARLRGSLMSDCTEVLRHGETSAQVVRVGSPRRGEDAANDYQMLEQCRVLAFVSDFPNLTRGSTVEYKGALRFVTRVSTNPTERTVIVGMTAELEDVVWTSDAVPRRKATFSAALAHRGPSQSAGNVYAPVVADAWTAFICYDAAEAENIAPGDTLRLGDGTTLTVQQVRREHLTGWVLTLTDQMKGPLS